MLLRLTVISLALLAATAAHADQPEAREVARINNCTPKKIEIFQNALGSNGKTIYQVTCNLPKTTDKESKGGPDALLISCDQSLCTLIRPITLDKK
jgi:cytochrome c5